MQSVTARRRGKCNGGKANSGMLHALRDIGARWIDRDFEANAIRLQAAGSSIKQVC